MLPFFAALDSVDDKFHAVDDADADIEGDAPTGGAVACKSPAACSSLAVAAAAAKHDESDGLVSGDVKAMPTVVRLH